MPLSEDFQEVLSLISRFAKIGSEILLYIGDQREKIRVMRNGRRKIFLKPQPVEEIIFPDYFIQRIPILPETLMITIKTPSHERNPQNGRKFIEIRMFRLSQETIGQYEGEMFLAEQVVWAYTTHNVSGSYLPPDNNEIYCDDSEQIYGRNFTRSDWSHLNTIIRHNIR